VAGGSVPKSRPRGWFVEPTVFADVSNSDRIAQEEIFGPVLTVIPYDTDADAVDIANASEYGLAGTVWSTDDERATDVARGVHTGSIGVNSYLLDMRAPFGGVKASGFGKELGPEGLDEYLVVKSIYRPGPAAGSGA
jgi:aldehyde dehydrogenase (NAD+)